MNKFSGLVTTDAEKFFLDEVVDWFYSLTSSVETEGEMNDSLSKLKVYIRKSSKDSLIKKSLVEATAKYLRERASSQTCIVCASTITVAFPMGMRLRIVFLRVAIQ